MINTIFYFVSTYDTYKQQWDNGEISSKTIVFIEDIKAIYKNNKRYGSMSDPDLYTKFEQFYNSTYDDSDLRDWLTRVEGLINDESSRLSGVIRDLDSDIQDKVTDMFDNDEWVRNNVVKNTYLHQNMNWDDQIHAYLQQVGYWTTDDLGNTITQWSKIQLKVNSIDSEVSALSLNVLGDFTALQSSLSQQINTELQTAKTEIGNTYARGTDIDGVKKIIEWMYSGLKSSVSPSMSYAAILAAALNEDSGAISDLRTLVDYINGNYISTGNLTTQVETYKNLIIDILSTAGVMTRSSLNESLSTLYSRLSTVEGQTSGIAALGTRVSDLEGAGFVAETDLASKIEADKERIILLAGLATKAQYDALGNTYLAKADLVTEIRDNKGLIASLAGLLLTSDLDNAVAALVSQTSSTKAAIEVIATGNQSSITVNADDINMTALHKLSLDSDYLTIASNFYSTVANNITLTADKITIDAQHQLDLTSQAISVNANNVVIDAQHQLDLGNQDLSGLTINANLINIDAQHQLDLTSQNLSIKGDQITMSSSHPLALNTTGVTINNQPFFDAIENRLDVGTVVTNQLESGTGTFKGNVEAKTFTAGSQGEAGIVVISGTFDPNAATDHSKMYFAYDPSQNAPNLYVWDNTADPNNNNDPVGWRSLSFANAMKSDTYFASTGWYIYNGNNDHYIKNSATSLSASDFTPVTLYISQSDNCYYDSNDSLNAALVSGMYYRDCYNDNSSFDTYYADSSRFTDITYYHFDNVVSQINGGYAPAIPMFQKLEVDSVTGKYVVAEIHCLYILRGYVANNAASHLPADNNIQSPISIQSGVTTKPTLSDCAQDIMYCNDAIINYTTDPSTGEITSITRGFAFMRDCGFSGLNSGGVTDMISTVVSSGNNVYSTSHLISESRDNNYRLYETVATANDAQHRLYSSSFGPQNTSDEHAQVTLSYTIPSAA